MGGLNDFTKEGLEALVGREIDFEKLTELCGHITDTIQEILDSCGLYFRIFSFFAPYLYSIFFTI